MDKVKVKIFTAQRNDDKVNEFIENNDIEIVDIRLAGVATGYLAILLLYKEKN